MDISILVTIENCHLMQISNFASSRAKHQVLRN